MSDSKNISKNGQSESTVRKNNEEEVSAQKEEVVIVPPKPPEPSRIIKTGGFKMQTNLPPEIALATLPHISSEERKMLIGEIAKENERMFEAFKLNVDFQNKNSKRNKIFLVFLTIVIFSLAIFLLLNGFDSFFEKILTLTLGAFGGSGTLIIILHKKGMISPSE